MLEFIQILQSNKYEYDGLPWNKRDSGIKTNNSVCTTIEIGGKFFLVTVDHAVCGSIENYCFNNDFTKMINLKNKKIIRIPEIDISIIKTEEPVSKPFILNNVDDFDINFKEIDDNEIFNFILPFNDTYKSLQCNIISITKKRYNNVCFPEMPIIIGQLTNDSLDLIDRNIELIKGASGAPIFYKDKIIGFLSGSYNDSKIMIVPSFLIKRIISELLGTDKFNGFCKSFINTTLLGNTFIESILQVDYNKYLDSNLKNTRVKKNDIINKIDDNQIINNKIYDLNLCMFIDIDTYFIINKSISSLNKFSITRSSKNIEITTGNIDIYSCTNIDILSTTIKYKLMDNYIYVENCPKLFEKLIEYRQFDFSDSLFIKMCINYNSKKKKDMIICDTLDNSFSIFNNDKIDAKHINNIFNPKIFKKLK